MNPVSLECGVVSAKTLAVDLSEQHLARRHGLKFRAGLLHGKGLPY